MALRCGAVASGRPRPLQPGVSRHVTFTRTRVRGLSRVGADRLRARRAESRDPPPPYLDQHISAYYRRERERGRKSARPCVSVAPSADFINVPHATSSFALRKRGVPMPVSSANVLEDLYTYVWSATCAIDANHSRSCDMPACAWSERFDGAKRFAPAWRRSSTRARRCRLGGREEGGWGRRSISSATHVGGGMISSAARLPREHRQCRQAARG